MRYYAGVGTHQSALGVLYQRLVPELGWSNTRAGELVRAVSALYRAAYDRDMPVEQDTANYFRYLILDHFMERPAKYRIRKTLFFRNAIDEDWDWLVDLVVEEVCRMTRTPLEEDALQEA